MSNYTQLKYNLGTRPLTRGGWPPVLPPLEHSFLAIGKIDTASAVNTTSMDRYVTFYKEWHNSVVAGGVTSPDLVTTMQRVLYAVIG